MKTDQHTPTPVELNIGDGWIVDAKGNALCRMPATCVTATWENRAAFIVRAVNCHEGLLETAKMIEKFFSSMYSHLDGEEKEMLAVVKKIIAKAEAK